MSPARGGALAALDCGTNSTRLLIVGSDRRVLDRQMRITRLGQGVDATHQLDPAAISRTIDVLADFRRTMDQLGVVRSRMIATSAVRDASNGYDFLRAASEVVGVQAELLDGSEEGRLAYTGAIGDLPQEEGDDVVIDIGGGSTELVVKAQGGEVEAFSMSVGCVRLTERYLHHDPPLGHELMATEAAIKDELGKAKKAISTLSRLRADSRLIGLAGTVSTLAALQGGISHYDRSLIHHSVLSRQAVEGWCAVLAGEPVAARAARPGMLDGRQDVILGGALVLRHVMEDLGFEECLVSESDILDGLIATMISP